jgi:aspartokinase/homoserine dehydrogenase 1
MSGISVHKFGGTSLATPERYRGAAGLVQTSARDGGDRAVVVVSAMAGVTDALISLCDLARAGSGLLRERLEGVVERHRDAVRECLPTQAQGALLDALASDATDLHDVLHATTLLRTASEQTVEFVAGHGELWSARLLAALLTAEGTPARFVDAREVLVINKGAFGPEVQWSVSEERARAAAAGEEHLVVTGFVCSLPDGTPTSLGRNGSDFSASIFARLLGAGGVTIWTDVEGVLSADPRKVPEAVVTPRMSYEEALELAYFGAKVLHPSTIGPAVRAGIPVTIRSALQPDAPGTTIGPAEPRTDLERGDVDAGHAVRGFASIDDISLVNVEGTGMTGVPGVAERLFGALKAEDVNVVLIAQASSEHSICFAVKRDDGERARALVRDAFAAEIARKKIEDVTLTPGCAILAAVGDDMAHVPGVTAKLTGALGRAGVNIRAMAQGSSERNISLVIDQKDAARGLRAAHAGFYLSEQTISVGLVGPGLIGAALLDQLQRQAAWLKEHFRIDVRVRGILSSKKMALEDGPIDLSRWREVHAAGGVPDAARFADHIAQPHLPHGVVIDCTAADLPGDYERWLDAGLHVLSPNKKPNAGPLERYRALRALAKRRGAHWFYEATVGAGLPVIKTLRDLVQTGDEVLRIEGVLSGTLSYLFNSLTPDVKFSAAVREAKALGYTEPDPRDDLNGTDVARKVVILARELGADLDLGDVPVESLVPAELSDTPSIDAFLDGLVQHDDAMRDRLAGADQAGEVLRYVGVIERDGDAFKARVELRSYSRGHAFAGLSGSDNIIAFTTARYREQPLLVQGPGAGPEVTAAGVFADLLRLSAHLGAPS